MGARRKPVAHHGTGGLPDAIYLSDGTTCLAFDAATGESTKRIDLPDDLETPWANLRVAGDYLVGSNGQHVLCMNRGTGELVWRVAAERSPLYLAVGGNKVFCSELPNPQRGEVENRDGTIFALNVATGERLGTRRHSTLVTTPDGGQREVVWTNTNQLLGEEGFGGIKTGTTAGAQACLVSSGRRGYDRLLVVVLGSSSSQARYSDTKVLFDWARAQRP